MDKTRASRILPGGHKLLLLLRLVVAAPSRRLVHHQRVAWQLLSQAVRGSLRWERVGRSDFSCDRPPLQTPAVAWF